MKKTRYNIAKKPKNTSKIHRNINGKMSQLRYKIQKNWELSQIGLQFDQIIENDFSITQFYWQESQNKFKNTVQSQ